MIVPAILIGTLASAASVVGLTTLSTERHSGPDEPRVPCGAVWTRLPADLKADLVAVKDVPDAERPAAIRAIREDALAGGYGEKVARAAEWKQANRERALGHLPDELRADIEALRSLTGEDKVAAAQEIRADAVAGAYGDRVQTFAERLQQRRAACRS